MALSEAHKEIRRLEKIANDPDRSPEERIRAVRKRLRDSEHAPLAVRLGKRIAKKFMNDEGQTAEVRKRAASLFQFVCDRKQTVEDREPEIVEPAIPPAVAAKFDPLATSDSTAKFHPRTLVTGPIC